MKQLVLAFGLLFLSICVLGQARDGTSDLKQTVMAQPAAVIYLPYAPQVVQQALINYLSKIGNKEQRSSQDFLLSENTLLIKNNISSANIYFELGAKDNSHLNESLLYLKLNSFTQDLGNSRTNAVRFDMQQAEDYLDNLAVAIKPYATDLQIKLQKKNLRLAQAKSTSLKKKANILMQNRVELSKEIASGNRSANKRNFGKRKLINQQAIDNNRSAQTLQDKEVQKQQAELALLLGRSQN